MSVNDVVLYVSQILLIVIQLLLINYLIRLEKIGCKCAMDWRRDFMIFYMMVVLLHAILTAFLPMTITPLLQTLVAALGIFNVIITLQYIARLKHERCKCSDSMYKDAITIIAYFNAAVYIALLILFFYLIFSLAALRNLQEADATNPSRGKKMVSVRPLFKPKKP